MLEVDRVLARSASPGHDVRLPSGAKKWGHSRQTLGPFQAYPGTKMQVVSPPILNRSWPKAYRISMVRRRSTVRFRKGALQGIHTSSGSMFTFGSDSLLTSVVGSFCRAG
jgi:hypothetical protein